MNYVIERLDLRDHIGKAWPELSGGFKLRFSLAKALLKKPKLLVLDEPLGNLDFRAQQVVLRDVHDLTKSLREPMVVLISSQHLHEIEAVSDSIVFLKKGQVAYNGPIDAIGKARTCNTYELGTDCDLDKLRQLLREANCHNIQFNGISYVITTRSTPSTS